MKCNIQNRSPVCLFAFYPLPGLRHSRFSSSGLASPHYYYRATTLTFHTFLRTTTTTYSVRRPILSLSQYIMHHRTALQNFSSVLERNTTTAAGAGSIMEALHRSEPNSHRSGPRTAFGGCPSISTRLYYSTRLNYSPIAMHIRIFIWWGISDLGTKSSYTSCISSSKMLANGQ